MHVCAYCMKVKKQASNKSLSSHLISHFTVVVMTTALTACDVMDDLEKSLSASLNFLFLLSTFVLVVLKKINKVILRLSLNLNNLLH